MSNSLEVMACNNYYYSQKKPKSNFHKVYEILYLRPKVECGSTAKETHLNGYTIEFHPLSHKLELHTE